jgi:hypothetical protein
MRFLLGEAIASRITRTPPHLRRPPLISTPPPLPPLPPPPAPLAPAPQPNTMVVPAAPTVPAAAVSGYPYPSQGSCFPWSHCYAPNAVQQPVSRFGVCNL